MAPSLVVVDAGPWTSVAEFLIQRFPAVKAATWFARLEGGDISDAAGRLLCADTPAPPGLRIYYFRDAGAEPEIPFEADILYQDQDLLVADKPHFLPVVPSGKYVRQTLLARLKQAQDLPALSPIHRIDRDTAGLVLFSVRAETRNAYQALFRQRAVDKVYECVAPWNPDLPWPLLRESRIAEGRHFMQMAEVDGSPNAITRIAPLEVGDRLARYELRPLTGQRHQLRVHMNALGLPILNDGIYPNLLPEGDFDYALPLQLLAREIAFEDPVAGQRRAFQSRRSLLPF